MRDNLNIVLLAEPGYNLGHQVRVGIIQLMEIFNLVSLLPSAPLPFKNLPFALYLPRVGDPAHYSRHEESQNPRWINHPS